MEEGKFVEWKVQPGDLVKKGQAIGVVETQKAAVEIESFRDGKVISLAAKAGDVIAVGTEIATMEVSGEAEAEAQTSGVPIAKMPPAVLPPAMGPRKQISPAAKKLAVENHLDWNLIVGSGPNGVIEIRDVEKKLGAARPPGQTTFSGVDLRRAIANQMAKSKREIPHYYLHQRMSLDPMMDWLDQVNLVRNPEARLMTASVLLRALVKTLQENPDLNGHYVDQNFLPSSAIHLGVAIALKSGGVLVPAILDAQAMSLSELNESFKSLAERARSGGIKNREMTDGTFTVTNVGDLGAHQVTGVIFPPQVAIVGIGRLRKEAVVVDGSVRPGLVVDVTLSADHRVSDGLSGSKFLNRLERFLQQPQSLE
jgi:pyruvate dehydrogenase E2 component (dihydrolipoamide acetyltransferase)